MVRVEPPRGWHPSADPSRDPIFVFSMWQDSVQYKGRVLPINTLSLVRFVPGNPSRLEPIGGLRSLFPHGHIVLLDESPRARRYLIWGQRRGGSTKVVVDAEGRKVIPPSRLPSATWDELESIGPDGQFGVGAHVQSEDDESGNVIAAKLYAVDFQRDEELEIVGASRGMNPRVSRDGRFLAYVDPFMDRICVGRLEVIRE